MNMINKKVLYGWRLMHFFLVAGCLAGCSQPLRTLMALDSEQKAQQRYVSAQNNKFDVLLGDVRAGRLKPGLGRSEITRLYGEPVLTKTGTDAPAVLLYRRPVAFVGTPKIYLDLDQNNNLLDVRLEGDDEQPAQ